MGETSSFLPWKKGGRGEKRETVRNKRSAVRTSASRLSCPNVAYLHFLTRKEKGGEEGERREGRGFGNALSSERQLDQDFLAAFA